MGEQFEIWNSVDPVEGVLSSLSITHAHLGHVDGLGLFGKEAMGAKNLIIHCSESVANLIEENPFWNSMRDQGVIVPNVWAVNQGFEPSPGCGFRIRPIAVPHRDELSDNHGLIIEGRDCNLLFLPDHDSWATTPWALVKCSVRATTTALHDPAHLLNRVVKPELQGGLQRR